MFFTHLVQIYQSRTIDLMVELFYFILFSLLLKNDVEQSDKC